MADRNVNRPKNAGKELTSAVATNKLFQLNLNTDIVLGWGRELFQKYRSRELNRRNIKNRRIAQQQFQHEGNWYQLSLDLVKRMVCAVKMCVKTARRKSSASGSRRSPVVAFAAA